MVREIPPGETALGYRAMREMRTHLESESAFVEEVDGVLRPEGYRLAGAFEDGTEDAMAVLGFRVMTLLAWGGGGLFLHHPLAPSQGRGPRPPPPRPRPGP